MPKRLHDNISYQKQDVTIDLINYEKDDEEKNSIFPPPAHAASSTPFTPSSLSSLSSSYSARQREDDVLLLPPSVPCSKICSTLSMDSIDFPAVLDTLKFPRSSFTATSTGIRRTSSSVCGFSKSNESKSLPFQSNALHSILSFHDSRLVLRVTFTFIFYSQI